MFSGHNTVEGDKYTGRAWFGVPEQDGFGQQKCDPIKNEAAHELAERLGFSRRRKDDFGTSIMILDSKIDIKSFREAVEDYWWPRLISDHLSVELLVGDDMEMPPPEPRLRTKLLPYIRCYNLIEDDIPAESDERRPKFNAVGGISIGKLALKALPPNDPDADEDPEQDTQFRNTVALIRTGPRMVVEYLDTGGRQRGNFAGAFVGHSDSERALHLSEPPAHNAWNPNSKRLREAAPTYPALVRSILGRVKQQTRRFQKELIPAPPPEPMAGTRKLEQILAGVMSSRGLGASPPPPPVQDPFQLRIREGRTNTPTGSTVTATVDIMLRDDAPVNEMDVLLYVRPMVVLDDNLRRDSSERLKLASAAVDGAEVEPDKDSAIQAHISKSRTVIVTTESEPFDRDMYADLEVQVRMSAGQASGKDSLAGGIDE